VPEIVQIIDDGAHPRDILVDEGARLDLVRRCVRG
jgi:hypothetical protein